MPTEDDQLVPQELLDALDVLEVVVGEEVRAVAAPPVPAEEADVELLELLREPGGDGPAFDVAAHEWIREVDDVDARVEVPAVAVVRVVRVPRVRRLDHEHRRRAQ